MTHTAPDNKTPQEKSELIAIAKNTSRGIGGTIFYRAIRLCTTLLITRTIGPEQYGLFILAMNVISTIAPLSLLGLPSAMVRFVSKYAAEKDLPRIKGLIAFGIRTSLLSTTILALLLFLYADSIAVNVFNKPDMAPVLKIFLLSAPFVVLSSILTSALQGAQLVKQVIFIRQILVPIFRFIMVAAVLWLGYRVIGITWVSVVTAFFGVILALFYLRKKMGLSFLFSQSLKVHRKKIVSFSLPLLLSGFFASNAGTIGILIIGMYYPAGEAGVYSIARRVIPFLIIPFISYNTIFSPIVSNLFTERKMDDLENIYKTGSKWVITLSLPIFVLLIFYSNEIASIFGSGFSESAEIMKILLIGQMIKVGTGSAGYMLSMTGRPLYNLFNTSALFVLNILLSLILIQFYGIVGVAIAFTASVSLIQFLQIGEVWYLYKLHPYRLDHIKPVLSCLVSFLIIYFLKNSFFIAEGLSYLGLTVIFLICYGVFLKAAGLSSDDRFILEKFRHKFIRVYKSVTQ